MELILSINGFVNGIVWGVPMMVLIVGAGIYFTIGTGFLQFRKFGYTMKNTIGKCFKKTEAKAGAVTPFQAMTTALAATVGTGNIAGVAGAIALGGPGAVFWMWVSALFGMATKFSEVTLAIHYRERNAQGDWVGGPMYYIKNGLGKKWTWLAVLFSLFGGLAAFGIGNMTQVNTIASSVSSAIVEFIPDANVKAIALAVGIIVAVLAALVLLGGLKRIGAVTEKLVPFMAIIYIVGTLAVICTHISHIGTVFQSIFVGAFSPQAFVGGVVGITIGEAIKKGVGRGVFSNEAGLGSAPIAHAAADTDSAVRQGLFGIFEVFADTIVICTLTALTILMSGIPIAYGQAAGAELTISAFTTTFGGKASGIIVAIGITLFATSTILSWGLYGTRCAEFLFGSKAIKPYQILFILFIVVGATMNLATAWAIADTLNGLMAIPNLIALLALSGTVFKLTKEYFAKESPLAK
ncbi:MAG: sodium:alanine symporter family protein [Oscillospiraceae bacterium]